MKSLKAACLVMGTLLAVSTKVQASAGDHQAPWFAGTADEAFAKAKAEKKPMLLYWGAIWCPPCHELKNEVFVKPRFAELMAPMLAVYLDGDSEDAQAWAEKLKVSGYPTVLVLDPDGREVWRLGTTVSIEEFEAALASALNAGKTADEAIERAVAGKASDDDWKMLASYSWIDTDGLKLSGRALWDARRKLVKNVPTRLTRERAQLAAAFVEACATAAGEDKTKSEVEAFAKDVPEFVDLFLHDDQTIKAARSTILYNSAAVIGWAYAKGQARAAIIPRWLAAADVIAKDPTQSIDTRLWSQNPKIELFQLEHQDQAIPVEIQRTVQDAVKRADQEAKSPHERHAVISGAASLLKDVGDFDGGRALLDQELKTTDTPWYYQSSYASLERKAGNSARALEFSEKARLSVKGRASRLQWIVEDLAMTTKLGTPDKDAKRLEVILKEYYETAFSLNDGFKGRNETRAKKVAENLKPWLTQARVKDVVKEFAEKCQANTRIKDSCAKHFAALSTGV